MTPLQFEKISVFRLENGRVYGFHNENLEVAQLSESLWDALVRCHVGEELAELQQWSDSVNVQVKNSRLEQRVKTLTINTTQLCNLKCVYCAAGGDGSYGEPLVKIDLNKGLAQLQWLMSRCLPGDRFQINFLGGEPLLYPEIMRSVILYAKDLAEKAQVALRLAVVTNGTRLYEQKVLDLLEEFRIAVTVSVDGPPAIQDRFRKSSRGGASSHELERGLLAVLAIKNRLPSIGLAAVFHKDYTGVRETYRYFQKWDVDFYELNFSHTEADLTASQEFSQGLREVAALADQLGGEDALRKIRSFDGIIQRLDEQIRLENFCGSGKSLLSMDARGDLYPCPWDINEKQLKLNSSVGIGPNKLETFGSPQIAKTACRQCWAKYLCGGGCHYTHKKNTGFSRRVDPIFCERMQDLITTTLLYYEKYRRLSDETHQNLQTSSYRENESQRQNCEC